MTLLTASDLSPAEVIRLLRRRRGESQEEAAKRHSVSTRTFRRWESGEAEAPSVSDLHVGVLAENEVCWLLRRRASMTIDDLAGKLGCSRQWLIEMETGRASCGRLSTYWKAASQPWRRPRAAARGE